MSKINVIVLYYFLWKHIAFLCAHPLMISDLPMKFHQATLCSLGKNISTGKWSDGKKNINSCTKAHNSSISKTVSIPISSFHVSYLWNEKIQQVMIEKQTERITSVQQCKRLAGNLFSDLLPSLGYGGMEFQSLML